MEQATKQAAQALAEAIPEAFEGDAHAFLMAVYKDPKHDISLRVDAAKAAVRYEKPALAAIDLSSENQHYIHDVTDQPLSEDEWAAEHPAPN
ncbi:hypothetical protein P7L87_24020 [Vibrio parahaemolyticus]|nr:hypothetical protein [Vibrio parahaemolyticus]